MADPTQDPNVAEQNANQRHISPGFAGALMDAIKAISGAFAPRGLTQRPQALQDAEAQSDPQPGAKPLGSQF